MVTILKKDIFNYPKNKKLQEFVSDSGDLIDDKEEPADQTKVYGAKGQTMDNMVKQTRQPNQNNGMYNFGYNYSANYSRLREEMGEVNTDFINSLPSNVINSLNNLIDSMSDVNLSSDDKNNILKYIHINFIRNGQ